MRTLVVPPAAQQDDNAVQMLSAWIAQQSLHCTLNIGMWTAEGRNEPRAWGGLLADVVRHIGNALQAQHGHPTADVVDEVVDALLNELNGPTSEAKGGFHPGNA